MVLHEGALRREASVHRAVLAQGVGVLVEILLRTDRDLALQRMGEPHGRLNPVRPVPRLRERLRERARKR